MRAYQVNQRFMRMQIPSHATSRRVGFLPVLMLATMASLLVGVVLHQRHRHQHEGPLLAPAREPVDVYSLGRSRVIASGGHHYALLGLGQDPDSGRQIVWLRDMQDNRVGGFGRGDQVFGAQVTVETLSPGQVSLAYKGTATSVVFHP